MCPTDEYTSNLQVEWGRELSHRFFLAFVFLGEVLAPDIQEVFLICYSETRDGKLGLAI